MKLFVNFIFIIFSIFACGRNDQYRQNSLEEILFPSSRKGSEVELRCWGTRSSASNTYLVVEVFTSNSDNASFLVIDELVVNDLNVNWYSQETIFEPVELIKENGFLTEVLKSNTTDKYSDHSIGESLLSVNHEGGLFIEIDNPSPAISPLLNGGGSIQMNCDEHIFF